MQDNMAQTAESLGPVSHVWQLIQGKPWMTAVSALASVVLGKLTSDWQDAAMSFAAICALVVLDWLTKIYACRKQGVPVTSAAMRQKGFPKLRDYLILCIAGWLTVPLMGEDWGYRSVLFMIALWELWSIAENLHDAGTLPFDIRNMALFDQIRGAMRRKAGRRER